MKPPCFLIPAIACLGISALIPSVSAHPDAKPGHPPEIDIENPETFYPHFLKKLQALPKDKQLDYATRLPVLNNPALLHRIRKQQLKELIRSAKTSGLGFRHPHMVTLRQRLNDFDGPAANAALRRTITILEGQGEPSLAEQEIQFLHKQLAQKTANGLGPNHPAISALKKRLTELEQEMRNME